jgi:hypothetical protein
MDDEYEDYIEKPVYCRVCSRKMGSVWADEKFPPREKRICSTCVKKTEPSAAGRKRGWELRKERKLWDEKQLAEERAERQRQQVYVRVPRYIISRLIEVAPRNIQEELAAEIKTLIEDPLPDDKKVDVPTDWLRRKQGRL